MLRTHLRQVYEQRGAFADDDAILERARVPAATPRHASTFRVQP
jgi:hypothetical protein